MVTYLVAVRRGTLVFRAQELQGEAQVVTVSTLRLARQNRFGWFRAYKWGERGMEQPTQS